MIKPEEYMSSPVITVEAHEGIPQVVTLMDTHNIGSIVVVNGEKVQGIVTERDVIRKVLAKGKDVADVTAEDIMTKDVHTIAKDATLMEVAALMKEHTMRRLVVTKDDAPVGIITSRDVISLLVE